MKDRLAEWIAWHLPTRVLYFGLIKIFAIVSSSNKFKNTPADDIGLLDSADYLCDVARRM